VISGSWSVSLARLAASRPHPFEAGIAINSNGVTFALQDLCRTEIHRMSGNKMHVYMWSPEAFRFEVL
jgi:hypothetical protein